MVDLRSRYKKLWKIFSKSFTFRNRKEFKSFGTREIPGAHCPTWFRTSVYRAEGNDSLYICRGINRIGGANECLGVG